MLFRKNKKGQTALEYVAVLILCIGAFLAMQHYVKRGLQGRWKAQVDELGDQYDPRTAVTSIRETLSSSTNTAIIVMNSEVEGEGGYWTKRTDQTVSVETRTGSTSVGAY